jgi:hypothetical protein
MPFDQLVVAEIFHSVSAFLDDDTPILMNSEDFLGRWWPEGSN